MGAFGADPLYRAKSGLALTRLLVEGGQIKPKEAIDRLERIRYIWRGDGLEAQVLFWLGRMYFEDGAYLKGLTLMRRAATILPDTAFAREVVAQMGIIFAEAFLNPEKLKAMSPVEAVALYDQFGELMPMGARADALVAALAEHLIKAGLLGRGADLLAYQVEHRLKGPEALRVALRVAAVRLEDAGPIATARALCGPKDGVCLRATTLLQAYALSRTKGQGGSALASLGVLADDPEVANLRADIAWRDGVWEEAARALADVLRHKGIAPEKTTLKPEESILLLRRAIALRLSDTPEGAAGLADMRTTWGKTMAQTPEGPLFGVITSATPDESGGLDPKDLQGLTADLNLFGEVLKRYKD